MSVTDDFRAVVARLRSWGFAITETGGCYGRSNGLGWGAGVPSGHINHHYVCSLNPAQSYIDGLVGNLVSGKVVNWFADVNGRGYLIGTGPLNHAGTGNSSVLARTRAGQAPPGPSNTAGDMTGNTWYSGTELQHPGDSTPYPQPMVDLMVAISAAEAMQWGWNGNEAINHFEWTGRKIDMSVWGGRATNAGTRMREAVASRMGAGPAPAPPPKPLDLNTEDDMALTVGRDENGVDYIYGQQVFQFVPTKEDYELFKASGLITVEHGKAPVVGRDTLRWTAGKVANWGGFVDLGPLA